MDHLQDEILPGEEEKSIYEEKIKQCVSCFKQGKWADYVLSRKNAEEAFLEKMSLSGESEDQKKAARI